jgi:hypothetical protein
MSHEYVDVEGEGDGQTFERVVVRGPNKIALIKAVRTITGAGLLQSKQVVEGFLASVIVNVETSRLCSEGERHFKRHSQPLSDIPATDDWQDAVDSVSRW